MTGPRITTPLGWLATRVTLGSRALRWSTTAALVVGILVVLGGGVVRVTGSGLGCPTAPLCEGSSLTPIPALGIHGVIEFSNRLVTVLLIIAVGWAIVSVRLQKPWDRSLSRLAWSMFWLVVVNAVAGAITVLIKLNPWVVAFHFMLAIVFLATATVTWHRARTGLRAGSDSDLPARAPALARRLAVALVASTVVLIVAGTLVSGAGPHSGDSLAVARIPVSWVLVASIHGILGTAVLLLGVVVVISLRDPAYRIARNRAIVFVVITLVQATIGLVQAFTGVPAAEVALHLVGASLVWVWALRVLLDADTELFAVRAPNTSRASLLSTGSSL